MPDPVWLCGRHRQIRDSEQVVRGAERYVVGRSGALWGVLATAVLQILPSTVARIELPRGSPRQFQGIPRRRPQDLDELDVRQLAARRPLERRATSPYNVG